MMIKKVISLLDNQVKEVEQQIEQSIENDAVLAEKANNIKKIKGISTTTIVILIAETNGFENFDDRAQLTSFAGYDVVHNQSGETLNGKTYISKKGNRSIRRALYLPAISVVKYEPHFKALYKRVYETSKIKMKGYVAVQENCSLQYLPYLKIIVPSFLTLQRGREKKKYPIRSL